MQSTVAGRFARLHIVIFVVLDVVLLLRLRLLVSQLLLRRRLLLAVVVGDRLMLCALLGLFLRVDLVGGCVRPALDLYQTEINREREKERERWCVVSMCRCVEIGIFLNAR